MRKSLQKILSVCMLIMLTFSACGVRSKEQSPALPSTPQEITAEMMTEDEFNIDQARKDYTNPNPGLSNPYIVGIDKNEYENAVLYTPSSSAYVIDASTYGVDGTDIEDDTTAMQQAINAARDYKQSNPTASIRLKLPAGKIFFYEGFYNPSLDTSTSVLDHDVIGRHYGIVVFDINDLTIEGTVTSGELATEIVFTGNRGFRGMKVSGCDNFRLYNLQFDWAELNFSSGYIVESYDSTGTVATSGAVRTVKVRTFSSYILPQNLEIVEYIEYDADTLLPRNGGNFLFNHNEHRDIEGVERLGDHEVKITFKEDISFPPANTRVSIAYSMHFSETFKIEHCKNLYVESVYVYAAPGMTFVAYSNENIYINRFMCILKPGTDRLLTSSSDVLHLKNTKGEIIINNSRIENSHDDAVNIGGHYTRPRKIMKNSQSQDAVKILYPGGMWGTFRPEAGDILMLTETNSIEAIAYYEIQSVEIPSDDGDGYLLTFTTTGGSREVCGEIVELEVDLSKIDAINGRNTQAFANLTRTPKVTIRNSLIRNKRNRGLLIQSRNVTIENCAFSNVLHSAISLLSEVSTFNESTPPKNVTIKNNKFLNNGTSDISVTAYGGQGSAGSPNAIQNITIKNNFTAFSKDSPTIYFQGASNINIEGNWFFHPYEGTKVQEEQKAAVIFFNVEHVNISSNLLDKGNRSNKSAEILNSSAGTYRLYSSNSGFDETDFFSESRDLNVPKATNASYSINIAPDAWDTEGIIAAGTLIETPFATDVNVKEVMGSFAAPDFEQKTYVFWTDNGIYIYFDVTDDSINFIQTPEWYLGDGFEFFLSTSKEYYTMDALKNETNHDNLQFFMRLNEGKDALNAVFFEGRTSDSIFAAKDTIQMHMATKAGGYYGAAFIPFTVIQNTKAMIDEGDSIAMSFNFGENDSAKVFKTFSTSSHPTTTNKFVPGNMVKYFFVN